MPVAVSLGLYPLMVFRRESPAAVRGAESAALVIAGARELERRYHRIGVALEAEPADSPMLAEAIALARTHAAELILLHVVGGVGGQWYGARTYDSESRQDEIYLTELTTQLKEQLRDTGVGPVSMALGYGDVKRELARLANETGWIS